MDEYLTDHRPKVLIARVDPELPWPAYETNGAVGFDLLARTTVVIHPGTIARIPTNVIVATPPGYALILASRSSTPSRHGLSLPHGIGIIDQDYCGPDDEVQVQVINFTASRVTVARGTKLAQGLFVRVDRAAFIELDRSQLTAATRGGFGSTD